MQICAFIRRAAVKFKFADWNSNKMLDVPSKEGCVSAYPGRPDFSSARTGSLTKPQLHRIFNQSNLTEYHRKVCEEPSIVTLCCQLHWWAFLWEKFSGRTLRSWGIRRCLGGLFILLNDKILWLVSRLKLNITVYISYCPLGGSVDFLHQNSAS